MSKNNRLFIFSFLIMHIITGCNSEGGQGTTPPIFIPPPPTTLTGISIEPVQLPLTNIVMGVGEFPSGTDVKYKAIGSYSDGSSQDVTQHTDWKSTNDDVAYFKSPGLLHMNNEGNAEVSASYEKQSIVKTVTVVVPKQIIVSDVYRVAQLNKDTILVPRGLSVDFEANIVWSNGKKSEATKDVSWGVTGDGFVNNDASVPNRYRARGNIGDEAQVYATYKDIVSDYQTITISESVLKKVDIQVNGDLSVPRGQFRSITATGYYDGDISKNAGNTFSIDITNDVIWHNSDASAFINENVNSFRAIGSSESEGKHSTIYANLELSPEIASNSIILTMSKAELSSIDVNIIGGDPLAVPRYMSSTFRAVGNYIGNIDAKDSGFQEDITNAVEWNSSNRADFINGSEKNSFKAIGEIGSTTKITAKSQEYSIKSNELPLVIGDAILESLTIKQASVDYPPEVPQLQTRQFVAEGKFASDATYIVQDITSDVVWASSSPDSFSHVKNTFKATGKISDIAQVTATSMSNSQISDTYSDELTVKEKYAPSLTVDAANLIFFRPFVKSDNIVGDYDYYNENEEQWIRTDWLKASELCTSMSRRLPTAEEIRILNGYTPTFGSVELTYGWPTSLRYWTATQSESGHSSVSLDIGGGSAYDDNNNNSNAVLCVGDS